MSHAPSVRVAGLILAAIVADAPTLLSQREAFNEAAQFLTARVPLSSDDLREVEDGRPIARTLEPAHGREVATIAASMVGVPARFYIEQLRDISGFKSASRAVLAVGTFSTPATIDDLAGLSLDPGELDDLRQCRPQACKVQLSSEGIAWLRDRIDASGGDANLAADRAFREILTGLVNRYRERGDTALMTYADSEPPISVAAEFQTMIGARPAILAQLPPLYRHLSAFPRETSGADDILYWSKERLGPVVVVTVTHLAIARLAGRRGDAFAAASKQIYGSHYFDASLGITIVVDAGDQGGRPRSLLVYANRSRIDALGGLWGRLKRAIVRNRTRASMRESLAGARTLVERRFERTQAANPRS